MTLNGNAPRRPGGHRVLIYSHDSFGLGHLRRCRAIANALVEAYQDLSVLILSGSPIIGSFDFGDRVDFVRVPGMIKLSNGDYTSHALDLSPEEARNFANAARKELEQGVSGRVLIIEDEPLIAEGIAMLVERLEAEVVAMARSHKEAVAMAEMHKPAA